AITKALVIERSPAVFWLVEHYLKKKEEERKMFMALVI
uniref:Uncharacterized protein n=1 Tax=Panagrolaimus sp. ES5 TaxID=591445 RepID=A0AC34FEG1_9BILA